MVVTLPIFLVIVAISSAFLTLNNGRKGHSPVLSMVVNRNLKININGADLCYDLLQSKISRDSPVVYLPGLFQEKSEVKASSVRLWCKRTDTTYLSADYFGVGHSSGNFADGTVGRWTSDTISLIEKVLGPNPSKVILVGHGVGTWISFLVAQQRPNMIGGIVGLSADPDFTEELLWKKLPEEQKKRIMDTGVCDIVWGNTKYSISRQLIEDGRQNLILDRPLSVHCPVRLIHAINDEEVPFSLALKLMSNIASSDASLVLLKGSSHAMEDELSIKTMRSMLTEVMYAFKGEYDLRSPGSG